MSNPYLHTSAAFITAFTLMTSSQAQQTRIWDSCSILKAETAVCLADVLQCSTAARPTEGLKHHPLKGIKQTLTMFSLWHPSCRRSSKLAFCTAELDMRCLFLVCLHCSLAIYSINLLLAETDQSLKPRFSATAKGLRCKGALMQRGLELCTFAAQHNAHCVAMCRACH
jgi:hypothetical protein